MKKGTCIVKILPFSRWVGCTDFYFIHEWQVAVIASTSHHAGFPFRACCHRDETLRMDGAAEGRGGSVYVN